MHKFEFLVPEGYAEPNGTFDRENMLMSAQLYKKGAETRDIPVPNSALSVRMLVTPDGTSLEFKKRGQLVYVNLFCLGSQYFDQVFPHVAEFYREYDLGIPILPKLDTWIHSIPVAQHLLREHEIILCQKMTVSFWYAVYGLHVMKSGN